MPDRLNILLITSDQQRYDTLGVTNPRIQTPALDRLAAEGTRFDRAYSPNPTCTPTRASMITGMYPSNTWECAAFAMLSYPLERPVSMPTLDWAARFSPMQPGA